MALSDSQQRLLEVFSLGAPSTSADGIAGRRRVEDEEPGRRRRLGKNETFSPFRPEHMDEAKDFYDTLLSQTDFNSFVQTSLTLRDEMNEGLFVFGVSWAVLDFPLAEGLLIPPIHETFPDKFVPADTINRAIKFYLDRTFENPTIDTPLKVTVDPTGSTDDEEQRVAYFREDIGLNSHHWHWHLVYPFNGKTKDRRGELFYYSHQQLCARYDSERLSVGLRPSVAMRNFDEPLVGYSPHLMDWRSGQSSASRPDGMRILETTNFRRWRERIMEAIHLGYLVDTSGKHVPLDAENGINLLGAVVEPSTDSVNPDYYGTLHNWLHVSISNIHDPTGKFMELLGVIGDNSTALRDPVFYVIHRFVDDLFNEYKITLPPYTQQELNFPDVEFKEVTVVGPEPNVISTFMGKATLQLNHAIRMKAVVEVEYEHLDNEPFTYKIRVNNKSKSNKEAMVRIFLAPRYDEARKIIPLYDQRRYFIEMDKFYAKLASGENTIKRKSTDSSVTLQYNPSFQDLKERRYTEEQRKLLTESYCSCGWPQHLLVPRGNPNGMDFQLFVMLTNYKEDYVGCPKKMRSGAISYCGAKDSKYPDKRPMGFPFDRVISTREFKTPNMSFTNIKIRFKGENA